MKKCNCVVNYHSQKEEYVLTVSMVKRGFDVLDMLWDTGAVSSVIYSNLLRNIKNVDKRQLDELEKLLTYNKESGTKGKYICGSFGTVSNKGVHGILCCARNVYVNHLHLEKFYFFILPADENKTRGLLGADFISCCERQSHIASDEIFIRFDEELYEQKFKKLCDHYKELSTYDLNLLTKPKSQQSTKTDVILKNINFF